MVILNVVSVAKVIGHVQLGAESAVVLDSFLHHLYRGGLGFATDVEEVIDF
jgi:hypothetical protein